MNKSERSMTTKILGVFVLGFALSSFASDSASAQESEFVGTWDLEVSLFPFPTSVPVTFTVNRPLPTIFSFSGFSWGVRWEVIDATIPTQFKGAIYYRPNRRTAYVLTVAGELAGQRYGSTVEGGWLFQSELPNIVFAGGQFSGYIYP